ncbi:hypothetical protein GCM10010358_42850 [Streptomyces minutiscleroticus]|uniref:Uncharacterized protein n=1 Tax=Streptomyces minutiscleroticus TaxID=68238 RepID=A0A918U356_9ACTN|nr:hypothetical protein GCM10010358_42850 [Streptomyces minutiscleroticus]
MLRRRAGPRPLEGAAVDARREVRAPAPVGCGGPAWMMRRSATDRHLVAPPPDGVGREGTDMGADVSADTPAEERGDGARAMPDDGPTDRVPRPDVAPARRPRGRHRAGRLPGVPEEAGRLPLEHRPRSPRPARAAVGRHPEPDGPAHPGQRAGALVAAG